MPSIVDRKRNVLLFVHVEIEVDQLPEVGTSFVNLHFLDSIIIP